MSSLNFTITIDKIYLLTSKSLNLVKLHITNDITGFKREADNINI